jgi:hypothetical protein
MGWGGRTLLVLGCILCAAACGTSGNQNDLVDAGGTGGADGSSLESGSGSSGGWVSDDSGTNNLLGDGSVHEAGTVLQGDPVTCDQASQSHSYVGCDYWPTVLYNAVWSIFDYAVVVANAGTSMAAVTVTGPGNTSQTANVAPGSLATIYLPWVATLKGADADNCGDTTPPTASVLVQASAYHLVSTVPVTVYQFNALEYKGAGGPTNKSWSSCPGDKACRVRGSPNFGATVGCYSFSNDASLLLPSTAMTGNYLVTGYSSGSYVSIVALQNSTTVVVAVSGTGQVLAGTGIPATPAKGKVTLLMNQGDVAELFGDGTNPASDLSGSIVQATCAGTSCPVEVFTGSPCVGIPYNAMSPNTCDHLEQTNFPAETLGKDYVVTVPTGPYGTPFGHLVRIYGGFDGTTLTYAPSAPPGCPTTINAGQVVECGIVTQDFEVTGSQPFVVGSFMESGTIVDPTNGEGDPSQSFMVAVEQYRTKYVFLAPEDYDYNYADIAAPSGASLTLDGGPVSASGTALGATGYSIYRVPLGVGQGGAHVLTSSKPVGLQVLGYGLYTSYQYPGGLDLQQIAAPPTIAVN